MRQPDPKEEVKTQDLATTDQLAKPTGSGVFISYRRDDTADISGRIYDRLVGKFGKEIIYKDVDSIPLGADFKQHIENSVTSCKVQLVIIGQQWLTIRDERNGRRRLDDPADFVRIEIETALNNNIIVIPVLVHGAGSAVRLMLVANSNHYRKYAI